MNKIFKWGGIGLVVLVVVVALTGNGGNKTDKPDSSASTTQGTDAVQVAGLNQAVTDGDLKFTVLSVEKKQTLGNQYTKKNAQGMFYVISLKIENVGKKTVTFDSSMAKVTDSQDREFNNSTEGQTAMGMASGKIDLFLQQIQPSLSYTGDIVFDLPADVSEPFLVVKGGLFSTGVKIKLSD
jgi:hypothetical protein